MLLFALVVAGIAATGMTLAGFLYRRFDAEEPPPLERTVTGMLLGVVLWIAANWALAIPFALTRRNLIVVAAIFVVAPLASLRHVRKPSIHGWSIAALIVIALWCSFALWRGAVVPPASDDALAYHLPRAVMIARAHGVAHFDAPDPRISSFPANYELLLADVLLLAGNDRLTEWIGTASYLLFLGVVAMYARRWWGAGLPVAACVIAAAGAPLLLLHSVHDKNDLLTAVFAAASIYWSARWCVERGVLPALLAIVFAATAIGTKMTAGAVAIGIAPFGIAALIRRPPRPRAFAGALLFALAALLFCGGWVFVKNARAIGGGDALVSAVPTSPYGHWRHLWELPYLIVRVSLGFDAVLPNGQAWPWPVDNVFSSHYGPLFGVAVLLLPFCVWRYRRDGTPGIRLERAIAARAAMIAFFVLLPLAQVPQIAVPSILRYVAFVLPVVYGWTYAPLIRNLVISGRRAYVHAILSVFAAVFGLQAADVALNDTFVPLEYARWCAEHPGTREIFWMSRRAASVVDRMAGPNDTIAVRATGHDSWVYPAYGAALSRKIVFVNDGRDIPADAQWVIVDEIPARHGLDAEDKRFLDEMSRNDRFQVVFRDERLNQVVYTRKKPAGPSPL